MSEHLNLYISKYIPNIIIIDLVAIMILKIASGIYGLGLTVYIYDRIVFILIPITYVCCQVKCHEYYENTFCKIRYKKQKQWLRNYYIENMILVIICTFIFFILMLFCDMYFEKLSLLYLFTLFMFTLDVFLLFQNVTFTIIMKKQNSRYLLVSSALSLMFMFLVIKNSIFYGFNVVFEQPMQITSYIIILAIANVIIGLYHTEILNKSGSLSKYIVCAVTYLLCYILFKNMGKNEFMQLPMYYVLSPIEIIMPMMIWCVMMIIIVYPAFQIILKEYQMNFLFYAIRVRNRKQWLFTCMRKICCAIAMQILINAICYIVVYQSFPIELIRHSILVFFYTLCFILIGFLWLQYWKDQKVIQYLLIFFLLFSFISAGFEQLGNIVFLRNDSFVVICSLIIASLIGTGLNLYGLNRFDYY